MQKPEGTRRQDIACALFQEGYNCAQSTFAAFSGDAGTERAVLLRIASPFGGGIAGRKESCGALTGMLMAAGLIQGWDEAKSPEEKEAFSAQMRALIGQFEEACGHTDCASLLNRNGDALPKREYCTGLVREAVAILEKSIGL
ncbi:C-GCAxxG-C-C family protein [Ruminococcaceae bacterium OttesenSCG-928-L11]|nr:C-GCAxxG-C-C family protein [Ruminococcaceae bacterium OttesenSCG-928-L11]